MVAENHVVQTTYDRYQPAGQEGMVASEWGPPQGDSRILESAAGAAFGIAVSQGSADDGAVIGGASPVGVTKADITLPASNEGKYIQKDLMGVHTKGDIWVKVSAAVTPATTVKYATATGIFGDTGGTALPNARYMTSAAQDGLAVLRLGA